LDMKNTRVANTSDVDVVDVEKENPKRRSG
jgi:hypothetical protein